MESGTESHGKNLIRGIIAQVIMMLMLINMVLNVKHCKDFGKIKVRLMKQILMDGFGSILDNGQVEYHKMMKGKGKLIDGKKL